MVPALRLDAALRPLVTKYFGKTQKVTRVECRVNPVKPDSNVGTEAGVCRMFKVQRGFM